MTTPAPCRSLYIHVPLCRSRCGYCDFYSEILDPQAIRPLVAALRRELEISAAGQRQRFDTIYVGGGTPTVLPADSLKSLLDGPCELADDVEDLEFAVEANPATVTADIAAVLANAGVSRVSIGAQSFDPAELRVLQRTHKPAQIAETVAACRQAGLPQINLDLIFGIPGQTLASWRRSLDAALALEPDHLSCYGLTYEQGTRLRDQLDRGHVQRVDPDIEADMYELAMDVLPAAGLAQYEISNFARPGCACRHNVCCWHNEPYLGIGPAAAGYVDGVRYKNVANTAAYIEAINSGRSPRVEQERLTAVQRARETAMLELRLVTGIDRRRFTDRYGTDPAELFADVVQRHVSGGLLEADDAGIRLTRAGRLLGDRVMADFL